MIFTILFAALAAALLIKCLLLRKAARELAAGVSQKLREPTNAPLHTSSRDGAMRELCQSLDEGLSALNDARLKFERGDAVLKTALTDLAHDVRTPLTAILGYTELLARDPRGEAAERRIAVIRERAETLKDRTDALFRYAVLVSAETPIAPAPLRLLPLLEKSLAAEAPALEAAGIEPAIEGDGADPVVLGDAALCARVFENILRNAAAYADGDLKIELFHDGVTFSNVAAALTPLQAGRLTDRYYTVRAGEGATGVGLSAAKYGMTAMGGSLYTEKTGDRLRVTCRFRPAPGAGT